MKEKRYLLPPGLRPGGTYFPVCRSPIPVDEEALDPGFVGRNGEVWEVIPSFPRFCVFCPVLRFCGMTYAPPARGGTATIVPSGLETGSRGLPKPLTPTGDGDSLHDGEGAPAGLVTDGERSSKKLGVALGA